MSVSRFASVFLLVLVSVPAAAEMPSMLGVSRNWAAYQAVTPDGKVCYALSKPVSTSTTAARDPMYLMISTWPDRKVQDELEVVPGYLYKEGEPVTAEVGSQKIDFFSRNDGGSGAAWVRDPGDETILVQAMRKGRTITVTGVSARGTRTRDTYSLSGITAALKKAHDACR